MKLIVENIRSLAGKHELSLAPLTLLIGENSSGKSTCLAALSAVLSHGFPSRPAFNEAPFDLGGYETIATYRGGRYGRAKHFALGYVEERTEQGNDVRMTGVYKNASGQPALASISAKSPDVSINLEVEGARLTGKISFSGTKDRQPLEIDIDGESPEAASHMPFPYVIYSLLARNRSLAHDQASAVFGLLERHSLRRAVAVAPVRTKPRRTYDPISDEFQPEGDHVPLVLARVLSGPPSKQRDDMRSALQSFGEKSGLFSEVKIRKFGPNPSDPFQILVAADARPFNLTDVGYGVSQALPVIVEATRGSPGQLLLLQQPEVHLHPRAQGALGSLFAKLVATEQKEFVIETHSDYLIDRIRQEVAIGTLPPDAVSLLFFERRHGETVVHSLLLDRHGNITNAPPSYRSFFLQEEYALLKRTEPTLFESTP